MGPFRLLARAYAHNKQCITADGGQCYDPFGKYVPTAYTACGVIDTITKYTLGGGRLVGVKLERELFLERPAEGDTVYITGTTHFNGEHEIYSVDTSDATIFYFYDYKNDANPGPLNIVENSGWLYFAPTSKGEIMSDALRVISHPSFPQVEGQGIYTYPVNPDITRNFIYHPVTKVDGVVQRTLSSNVFIMQPQLDEDVIITEIWLGDDRKISTFAEMARVFQQYWTTIPDPGEALGWEPRDVTSDRFKIQIVRVQLGGIDFEYKEVRAHITRNQDAMLNRQLTLQFKLAKVVKPPLPSITLSGR